MMYNFNIPTEIKTAFEYFYKNGYEAWLVGGCVRDFLMGKIPHDYDMTTNALPEKTKEIFKDFKVIETGIKHGTVTVVIQSFHIEITTYRVDGEYSDNRHPKEVTFTKSITDDLMRRDFTMNAIAYNPKKGLFDPFDGEKHIYENKIMCVGNADKRFNEDGLRILRAIRFSSVLAFDIEEATKKSIHNNKDLLKNISKERIFIEFSKLISGKNANLIIKEYSDVLSIFLNDASDFSKTSEVITHTPDNIYLKLAAFVFSCDILSALTFLKASNDIKTTVKKIISYIDSPVICEKNFLKRFLNECGEKNVYLILDFKKAILISEKKDTKNINLALSLINEIIKNNECFSLRQLSVNGNDLIKLGFSGCDIKKILDNVLSLVINDAITNDNSTIIGYINENFVDKTGKK